MIKGEETDVVIRVRLRELKVCLYGLNVCRA